MSEFLKGLRVIRIYLDFVISFLPVRAKRVIPLFAVSSSIAQLLCQNGTAGKGKKRLYRRFLI
ncbi:hypothetical protein [Metabacillus indicus]|uniref:hypothetical protein n=1 Tax=Metabacillus indicus TaxID=246786 RepID=UPI00126832F3|nr:hypothetical protein [Metabacillus indicus]